MKFVILNSSIFKKYQKYFKKILEIIYKQKTN